METLLVLRQVITKARFSNLEQLVGIIREAGRRLVDAQPKGGYLFVPRRLIISLLPSQEHSVGNTVRKVLHHVREEYHAAIRTTNSTEPASFSISKFVSQGQHRVQAATHQKSESKKESDHDDPDSFARGLKPVLMEAIQDVLDELETVYDHISKNAKDHIHSE